MTRASLLLSLGFVVLLAIGLSRPGGASRADDPDLVLLPFTIDEVRELVPVEASRGGSQNPPPGIQSPKKAQ